MLLFAFLLALAHSVLSLEVRTSQGVVQGARAADGDYTTFYGIHYGGNTAGENRFKGPTPAPNYSGTFIAQDSSIFCAQPMEKGLIGTEDCLTLNIFTNGSSLAKPVLVWLQGEESLDRSFNTLVTDGFVVVQMNYRLSIFGFLCLEVQEAPGNAGLKDIVQGLQWIQRNIAGFGGDPNNVVLFGHGSAAAMVDLITISPLAKGLAHKAIALSGSVLAPWVISSKPIQYAQAFGAQLGYIDKSPQDLAKHLITTDITLIGNAFTELISHNNYILFTPCIENAQLNPSYTFLADDPINILKSGNFNDIPYIAGYNNKEGILRAEQEVPNPNWMDIVETNFTLDFGNKLTSSQKAIEQRSISDEVNDFFDYLDSLVLSSVIKSANERAATAKAEVWLIELSSRKGTEISEWPFTTVPLSGARHGVGLDYMMDHDLADSDKILMTSLINRVAAFARTGKSERSGAFPWLPVTATRAICINCSNCVNCSNCINCTNCNNCVNCTNCHNSYNLNQCTNCENSYNVRQCTGCYYSNNIDNCINCHNSNNITNCTNCTNCSNCRDCTNCSRRIDFFKSIYNKK